MVLDECQIVVHVEVVSMILFACRGMCVEKNIIVVEGEIITCKFCCWRNITETLCQSFGIIQHSLLDVCVMVWCHLLSMGVKWRIKIEKGGETGELNSAAFVAECGLVMLQSTCRKQKSQTTLKQQIVPSSNNI